MTTYKVLELSYTDIHPEELASLTTQNSDATIIDMRDPVARAEGTIDGAKPNTETLMQSLIRRRRQQPLVVVYCYHGNASRDLCELLSGLGLERVYNLCGGWHAWQASRQTRILSPLSDWLMQWMRSRGFVDGGVNAVNGKGMTALMQAALDADAEAVERLLHAGADCHQRNQDGHHALWFACVGQHVGIVECLCRAGCNVDNLNINGVSCAMYAASSGRLEVLQALVRHGADLSLQTPDDFNALDLSATADVLRYLRKRSIEASGSCV